MTIIEKLNAMGFDTVDPAYYAKVAEWKEWYTGDVKKFHHYRVRNGKHDVKCRRYTLNMAKKVAEDWANLLMNEKVEITLEGEKEQEFVDRVLNDNNFRVMANEAQEKKCALGSVAYVPRVVGQKVDTMGKAAGATRIEIDYPTSEHIYPLSWKNGEVEECAFNSVVNIRGDDYCYLVIHRKGKSGNYIIENHVFCYDNGQLSDVDISTVPEFAKLPPLIDTGSNKKQFVIDRPNIANNLLDNTPLGIPVFANAIDSIMGVDIAYDSYVNEFVLGKKRIMVQAAAIDYVDGEPVFDSNDVTFYVLPEDTTGGDMIKPIDMALRTAEHNRGLQDQLNILSAKCGFGESHYRFDGGSVATATQVVSENSTMFRTIKKHEIILENVLTELCRIILRLGNTAMNAGLDEDVEISIDFDDSIIEDKQSEFNRDMQLLNAGILNDWEFRMKWMNEDKETARAALPGMESMTGESEEREVE